MGIKMRISIIPPLKSHFNIQSASNEGLGGIETCCIELTKAFSNRGHFVNFFTGTHDRSKKRNISNYGFDEIHIPDADFVLSCNNPVPLMQAKGKSILWLHNPIAIEKSVRMGFMGPILKLRPHAVFGSRTAKLAFSRLYPFKSREIIPLGISNEFLFGQTHKKRDKRFIWSSQPQRGLTLAINAWVNAFPNLPDGCEFVIFGAKAAEVNIPEKMAQSVNIIFKARSNKKDLADFYETSLALVSLGAQDETFCLVAAEAQSMGLPVLTMGIGALAERVSHGINGIVVKNIDELSSAFIQLAKDDELALFLKEGSLANRTQFSWERTAKLWENYFDTLS